MWHCSSGADDAVDRGVGIGRPGKFLPGTAQEGLPFGRRQAEKGIGGQTETSPRFPDGHGASVLYVTGCHIMIYDSLSSVNHFVGEFLIRSQFSGVGDTCAGKISIAPKVSWNGKEKIKVFLRSFSAPPTSVKW